MTNNHVSFGESNWLRLKVYMLGMINILYILNNFHEHIFAFYHIWKPQNAEWNNLAICHFVINGKLCKRLTLVTWIHSLCSMRFNLYRAPPYLMLISENFDSLISYSIVIYSLIFCRQMRGYDGDISREWPNVKWVDTDHVSDVTQVSMDVIVLDISWTSLQQNGKCVSQNC